MQCRKYPCAKERICLRTEIQNITKDNPSVAETGVFQE